PCLPSVAAPRDARFCFSLFPARACPLSLRLAMPDFAFRCFLPELALCRCASRCPILLFAVACPCLPCVAAPRDALFCFSLLRARARPVSLRLAMPDFAFRCCVPVLALCRCASRCPILLFAVACPCLPSAAAPRDARFCFSLLRARACPLPLRLALPDFAFRCCVPVLALCRCASRCPILLFAVAYPCLPSAAAPRDARFCFSLLRARACPLPLRLAMPDFAFRCCVPVLAFCLCVSRCPILLFAVSYPCLPSAAAPRDARFCFSLLRPGHAPISTSTHRRSPCNSRARSAPATRPSANRCA